MTANIIPFTPHRADDHPTPQERADVLRCQAEVAAQGITVDSFWFGDEKGYDVIAIARGNEDPHSLVCRPDGRRHFVIEDLETAKELGAHVTLRAALQAACSGSERRTGLTRRHGPRRGDDQRD